MTLVKRTDRFPSVFDDLFATDWFGGVTKNGTGNFNTPAVNIRENEDSFMVELAAPGLNKADFNIELDNDLLSISSEKEVERETNGNDANYTRKEFSYTSFKRSFTLPETINPEAIEASYKDGILLITLPKKEEAKVQPKRLIEIS
ncbi:Hsp20/alpha crystallin family protein [Aquimarina brevivitae]|uniref:Heat shock protein Hsp20 n=1 Tax=Aquimarina brevivitae TaxID=323412 RepID=A0A4Q7PIS1_9FLAO|nr:Hsp20/alpha crystallin family protein [Aquimarina brevivitae]RZT00326.1 heat shock protein Hsp20 [Aquimarina brevivitae]